MTTILLSALTCLALTCLAGAAVLVVWALAICAAAWAMFAIMGEGWP